MTTAISKLDKHETKAEAERLKHTWIAVADLDRLGLAPGADAFGWRLDGRDVFLSHHPYSDEREAKGWARADGIVVLYDGDRRRIIATNVTFDWVARLGTFRPTRDLRDSIVVGD